MTGFEKTTAATGSCEDNSTVTDDVSELNDKIRGLVKIYKAVFRNVLASLESEKFRDAEKKEKVLENQNSKDTVQHFAGDLANQSEGKSAHTETEICKGKPKRRSHDVQEENRKFRNNMEKLLQKAQHWSEEHSELSGLIKSYQKSHHDIRELLGKHEVRFQDQPHQGSINYEMEEQVKKLEQDTYSLHLIAALLENECQILQQRIGLLNELHERERAQIGYRWGKEEQKSSEAKSRHRQKIREMEGTFKKRENFRKLDVFHNKKAHNNFLNSRIARRGLLGIKRSATKLR
ncbi:LOW QUALITY PROTEIN: spermatogenic leucine zipper protein 1 [Rhynchocyon petersi]